MTRDSQFSIIESGFAQLSRYLPLSPVAVFNEIGALSSLCLQFLLQCNKSNQGRIGQKNYYVFRKGNCTTRPILESLFIDDNTQFCSDWNRLSNYLGKSLFANRTSWNKQLYTAIMSFACIYDLEKPGSRKTPGTYYEILITSLLATLTGWNTSKFIPLPEPGYSVTTDIVLENPGSGPNIVIPTKITTRERVSQPFVHQKILDSVYPNKYETTFVGVSELQRDGTRGVNEICVPKQLLLYNKYVSQIAGFYYLDLPSKYSHLPGLKTGSLDTLINEVLPSLAKLES